MKNNLLFNTTINVVVLVFFCFMFKAFFNQKNWKHRVTLTALPFLFLTFFRIIPLIIYPPNQNNWRYRRKPRI